MQTEFISIQPYELCFNIFIVARSIRKVPHAICAVDRSQNLDIMRLRGLQDQGPEILLNRAVYAVLSLINEKNRLGCWPVPMQC